MARRSGTGDWRSQAQFESRSIHRPLHLHPASATARGVPRWHAEAGPATGEARRSSNPDRFTRSFTFILRVGPPEACLDGTPKRDRRLAKPGAVRIPIDLPDPPPSNLRAAHGEAGCVRIPIGYESIPLTPRDAGRSS